MFLGFCSLQADEDCLPVCAGCELRLGWGFPPMQAGTLKRSPGDGLLLKRPSQIPGSSVSLSKRGATEGSEVAGVWVSGAVMK